MSLADSFISYFTLRLLASTFPDLEVIELGDIPNHVDPGGQPFANIALRVNSTGQPDPPTAILVCGLHGRELMNTQSAIYFLAQLMVHLRDRSDWDLANMHYPEGFGVPERIERDFAREGGGWSSDRLRKIFDSLQLLIVPNANPNGRDANFAGSGFRNDRPYGALPGRKNLRPVDDGELARLPWPPIGPCASSGEDGVDLNRNFPFLFGQETARTDDPPHATTSRCQWSNQFGGPSALSEVESQMIHRLLEEYPSTRLFVDTHSFATDQTEGRRRSAGFVLHPWAFAGTQTGDPNETVFGGPLPIDPARERWTTETDHAEYMPEKTLRRFQDSAALLASRSTAYTDGNGYTTAELYPVTGDSSESAFARQFEGVNPDVSIYGWALETGRDWWEEAGPSLADVEGGTAAERFERLREVITQSRAYDDHINGTIAAWLTLLESVV